VTGFSIAGTSHRPGRIEILVDRAQSPFALNPDNTRRSGTVNVCSPPVVENAHVTVTPD